MYVVRAFRPALRTIKPLHHSSWRDRALPSALERERGGNCRGCADQRQRESDLAPALRRKPVGREQSNSNAEQRSGCDDETDGRQIQYEILHIALYVHSRCRRATRRASLRVCEERRRRGPQVPLLRPRRAENGIASVFRAIAPVAARRAVMRRLLWRAR